MTPQPMQQSTRDEDIVRRMDTLERRQDDRHRENQAALQEMQRELKPIANSWRSIMGDENYPGRMRMAEDTNEKQDKAIDGLNKTIAKWSGAIIAAMTILTLLAKFWK